MSLGVRNNNNSKGVDIYNSDIVNEFTIKEEERFDYIKAKVKGSRSNHYKVNIVYDIKKDYIDEVDCECPAFSSYSGLCKYCVVVLLEYTDYKERKEAIVEYVSKQQAALAKLKTMKGMKKKPHAVPQKKYRPHL